jgi:hypothetical protein
MAERILLNGDDKPKRGRPRKEHVVPPIDPEPQFLTKEEVARRWRISLASVPRYVKRGVLKRPVEFSPTTKRFRLEDVLEAERRMREV